MSDTLNYDYPPGATPQEIWAILREVAEGQKETRLQMQETRLQMQETDRRIQETDRIVKETSEKVKETSEQMKKTEEQMKRNDKKFGELHNRFGELAEHMVAPRHRGKNSRRPGPFGGVFGKRQRIPANGGHFQVLAIQGSAG